MRAKLTFPLSVAFAAAFAAQIEGMMVTRWASDRGSACSASSPAGACSLNGIVSFIAGTFFAVETLAATLTALVLYRNGKRFSAAVAATALVAALAVEHAWLLTYAR
ncbi:MAG: hypothetical protein E6G02_12745 [Actinobacteria bacterium]|jgi:hypothetical protein|nr:MAG: hypothetical protein E6G02_12745 [Actinomycetota bacterium]